MKFVCLSDWLHEITEKSAAAPFDIKAVIIEARTFSDKPGEVALVAYLPNGDIWSLFVPCK